jgi:hypothetical protein
MYVRIRFLLQKPFGTLNGWLSRKPDHALTRLCSHTLENWQGTLRCACAAGRPPRSNASKNHQEQPKSNSHLTQKVQKAQETQAPVGIPLLCACLEVPKDASRPDRKNPFQGRRHVGCSARRLRSFCASRVFCVEWIGGF